jgi:adenylosuccinate lyase
MGRGAEPVGGSGGGAAGAPPQNQMIDRYTRPEMGLIWSQESRYESWLQVELAVCEVYARRGLIPADALGRIKAGARVSAARIAEIEATTRHDVVAFLTHLEEALGADSRYVHMGLTSSDVVDTAQALQLQRASDLLLAGLERFRAAVRALALAHRNTLCAGRTHGVHAEPMVFGLKPALWYAEAGRNLERLRRAREAVRVGKISGAVGTFAHVDPDVEEDVCRLLGLEAAPVSTQIVQRDRHAEFCATLGIAAASLEKVALEIRSLQRTEVLEAEEPFGSGQKGSSAMPHKRNPVSCEQVCGLARVVRGHVVAALEDVALWHERDISHSSVERVILPDITALLDYMLDQMTRIVGGLQVYPARMRENMDRSFGLLFSQRVLLRLAEKGLPRQRAYDLVQRNAMRAWREKVAFRDLLAADPEVAALLPGAELDACFDPSWYLRNVDAIYRRAGLL